MRKLYTLLFCCVYLNGYTQIVAPDTVCLGTTVNFSTPAYATSYSWDFDTVSVVQPISPFTVIYSGAPLSTPAAGSFNNDSGNYYLFIMNYATQAITRLSYGTDFNSTPVATDLGTYGLTAGDGTAVEVVKDSATNQWYGIATNYSQMLVLSFGTSLSNIPTGTVSSFSGIVWAHTIAIRRYGGNWIMFVANRSGNIVRYDFGTSLTSVPVQNILPNVGGCTTPVDFTLYEQSSNWYMLISDLATNSITRYDFGTNLLNNAPVGTSLGNPGGLLNLPRNINLLNDCEGHLICYIGNEGGHLTKLDFGGDITSTPTPTDMGLTIDPRSASIPCSYADSFCYILVDGSNNRLIKYHPFDFSTPTFINYYNPDQPYTFPAPGTYHVSLFCDQSSRSGTFVYCKDIVVVSGIGTSSGSDTDVCTGTPLLLHADTTGTYLWSTGDTTSSISITASGTYWVTTATGPCTYKSDTTHVTYGTGVPVNLGDDTTFCAGHSLSLSPAEPAGSTYTWSTGAAGSSISVGSSGTYWLTVHSGSCSGSDTIHVTVNPIPPVNLGHDTTLCSGTPITLHSSDTYTSPGYLWNTGSTAATISPATSGTYALHVTVAGCTGSDTVLVDFNPTPAVNLGEDTAFCVGDSLILTNLLADGSSQLWSSGSTGPSIIISTSGTYWLAVTDAGCTGRDSIHVTVNPIPPVNLGPDTTICQGKTIALQSSDTYTSPAYLWSTGSTNPSITATIANTYRLDVTVAGCTGSDTMNLMVNPMPVLNLGNDTAICAQDSITLSPQEPAGTQYLWSTGSNNSAIEVSGPGTYKLTITQNGCSTVDSIKISNISVPKIDLGPDTTLCSGDVYNLSAGSAADYTWSNGDVGQTISITQSGTYWAMYKSVCGIVSDTVHADFELCDIGLPSAFTPNGDGLNDIIRVIGNLQLYKDFSFSIYNRWGQRVFYTNDIYEGWDGKFNGVKQDMGTYYYMLFYSLENKSHMKKGDIELIR